jgi:isoleucyl-tRNA synthetase
LPHHGHLLTGYVKDVMLRCQTMQGRRVERRFGWHCHGLPAEFEAEMQLGISHKTRMRPRSPVLFNLPQPGSVPWRNRLSLRVPYPGSGQGP